METKEKVLATMKEAGEPLNAGKIAELSGLDRKEVDKAMKQLKEEIESERERLETAKARKATNDELIQQEKDLRKEAC